MGEFSTAISGSEWKPPSEIRVPNDEITDIESQLHFHANERSECRATIGHQTYMKLKDREIKKLERRIHSYKDTDLHTLHELFERWKDPDHYHSEHAQSYELAAKQAFDIPAQVRHNKKGVNEPGQAVCNTLKKYYLATQCFLEVGYGGLRRQSAKKRVFRGLHERSIAVLVAQTIDNPEVDRYYFKTSVISNHTGLEDVASYHSGEIIIDFELDRHSILLAIDRLYNGPIAEDELQIPGEIIWVGSDGIIHEGSNSGDKHRLATLIQQLDSPDQLSADQHRDIADLLEIMYEEETGVTTDEGADRIEEWRNYILRADIFPTWKTQYLNAISQYLTEVSINSEWEEF